jgi:hypothetical protein
MSAIPVRLPTPPRPVRVTRRLDDDRPAPVEIITPRARRRARPRLLAAVAVVGGLFSILAAQLLLTIATSEGAYQIQDLQSQQVELSRDEQQLQEQLAVLDAPQHLASEAQAMGMVPNASIAYLRLSDGDVLGSPAAASASEALKTAEDGTPLIPDALLATVPLAASEDAAAAAAAALGSAEPGTAEAGAPQPADGTGSIASDPPAGIPASNTH